MSQTRIIVSKPLKGYRPVVGVTGEITRLYSQLKRIFAENEEFLLLAEPIQSTNKMDWYTTLPGEKRMYSELSEKEQENVKRQLAQQINHLLDVLEQQNLGNVYNTMKVALDISNFDDIYLFDDKIVLTQWGFAPDKIDAGGGILKHLVHLPPPRVTITLFFIRSDQKSVEQIAVHVQYEDQSLDLITEINGELTLPDIKSGTVIHVSVNHPEQESFSTEIIATEEGSNEYHFLLNPKTELVTPVRPTKKSFNEKFWMKLAGLLFSVVACLLIIWWILTAPTDMSIMLVDVISNAPVEGGIVQLTVSGKEPMEGTSDQNGMVLFPGMKNQDPISLNISANHFVTQQLEATCCSLDPIPLQPEMKQVILSIWKAFNREIDKGVFLKNWWLSDADIQVHVPDYLNYAPTTEPSDDSSRFVINIPDTRRYIVTVSKGEEFPVVQKEFECCDDQEMILFSKNDFVVPNPRPNNFDFAKGKWKGEQSFLMQKNESNQINFEIEINPPSAVLSVSFTYGTTCNVNYTLSWEKQALFFRKKQEDKCEYAPNSELNIGDLKCESIDNYPALCIQQYGNKLNFNLIKNN
ncbi:MAG: hypothetical protein HQM12_19930 [SAR324 cluster bacterium]|nr:hypothetical protein [SAR324 cluster bacterium]